ncbi:MFS transporter [Suillus cothurnatus]|nr:MFS transporter [Suillus cothurnatus]
MDPSNSHEIIANEITPLLPAKTLKKPKTPLPKRQIGILMMLQLVEPIASTSIFPYINQLIRELGITGGNDAAVGYYAGIVESLFFVAQALTVLRWTRLSDRIGRKPVLVIGLSGTCISILFFGLSRSFWSLIISRCMCGFLNGNAGVMKTMMGELTDSTNMAQAFSLFPIVWCIGGFVGPLIGGMLARPQDHWPALFANSFWGNYPYFLPCAVTSCLFVLALFMMSIFSEEGSFTTVPSTPTYLGGLQFAPSSIGSWLAFFGIVDGVFQVFFFAKIVDRLGPKRVFCMSVSCYAPVMVMFPIMSWLVNAREGVDHAVTFTLLCQLLLMIIWDMAFGTAFMFVTASAPTNTVLGAIHGLGQTSASMARAVGPALATSLFAVSKERNFLAGNAAYVVLIMLAVALRWLGSQLPDEIQDRNE